MKLKPLAELMAMTKQALAEHMAPLRARKAKAKAELKLADNDAKLIDLETRINQACTAEDIDFDKVIDLMDDHELLTRRNTQLKAVIADLFPTQAA